MESDLVEILQKIAGLSDDTLQDALKIRMGADSRLGEILIQNKSLTETQLLEAYSVLYQIPFWSELPLENIGDDFTHTVPIQYLKKYLLVPMECNGQNRTIEELLPAAADPRPETGEADSPCIIAINDPAVFQPLDDLVKMLGIQRYRLVLSTKEAILSFINMSYDFSRNSAQELVQNMEEDGHDILSQIEDTADLLDDTSDAPIIRLVNHIISQSSKARASDIHIESYRNSFKVRYRVDGILYDLLSPPKWILPALISRIKVMANMNIAEKRLPQDGRLDVRIGDQDIDVRVSTIPTSFGERAVLRLLNKSNTFLSLTDLGLLPERLELLQSLIATPNGIILVTGPTGSGKTTSLYAVLSAINKPDINIITIEDPIEYRLDGISQIQVNPKINLTFASGLRSIVRQDPDVLLIGEIRDRETADIAVQSALTGHLVFSTLHTNDSASAITRMVDIGVEPFLITSSVIAVVAQRLIRVLCDHCKEPFQPDGSLIDHIGLSASRLKDHTVFRAKGCEHCFQTGYRGRIGVFEIMVFTDELKGLILKTFDSNQIKQAAQDQKMITLHADGIQKVLQGQTTFEEVLRVTAK
jgi:general secretion pathway protein E